MKPTKMKDGGMMIVKHNRKRELIVAGGKNGCD